MLTGFYMDESGNTGFGDIKQQPVLCYGGIIVPNDKLTQLENEFKTISYAIRIAIQDEIKGLSSKELAELEFFSKFEIHGKPLVDGDNLYSKISDRDRFTHIESMINLLIKYDIKIIAAVIDKESYKTATGETKHINMHTLGFTNLIKTLEVELTKNKQLSVITCDNGKPTEIDLLLKTIRQNGNEIIFNDIAIKDSHLSPLVQLADLIVFITTIFYRSKYGHVRKHFNSELVDLYNQYLSSQSNIWEYV